MGWLLCPTCSALLEQALATHLRRRHALGLGLVQASPNVAHQDEYVIHHHQPQTCQTHLFRIFSNQEAVEVIAPSGGAVHGGVAGPATQQGTMRPFKGLITTRPFPALVRSSWATFPMTPLLNTLCRQHQVPAAGGFLSLTGVSNADCELIANRVILT